MSTLLMLPPQEPKTRAWAARVKAAVPALEVIVAEDDAAARSAIGRADCAFGTIPPDLLAHATRLAWLQAPQAAPPAGYYYPALVQHPVVITNFREIYNDHIAAHIMAFVLAFARDFHRYLPQQARREWRPAPLDTGIVHLSEATALIVGVGGIGAEAARLAAAFGMTVLGVDARRKDAPPGVAELHPPDALDTLLPRADFVILTVPHTPATEGFMHRARFRRMKRTALLASAAVLLVATAVPPAHAGDADDTGRNVRDRDPGSPTAGTQSNDHEDLRVTQEIRRAVTQDRNLSTDAHNVKIITNDGVVTLRGPVASADEKAGIEAKAKQVSGVKRIDNQLEVSSR